VKKWQHDETGRTCIAEDRPGTRWNLVGNAPKTQKQRSAEFRARKAETPEVRGIFAPKVWHDKIREHLSAFRVIQCATKKAKRE